MSIVRGGLCPVVELVTGVSIFGPVDVGALVFVVRDVKIGGAFTVGVGIGLV